MRQLDIEEARVGKWNGQQATIVQSATTQVGVTADK